MVAVVSPISMAGVWQPYACRVTCKAPEDYMQGATGLSRLDQIEWSAADAHALRASTVCCNWLNSCQLGLCLK